MHYLSSKSFSFFQEIKKTQIHGSICFVGDSVAGGERGKGLFTSRFEHSPSWTCKVAKSCYHLAAVWWPVRNELVVTIQFRLDRCPLHKTSSTISSLVGRGEDRGLGMENTLPLLLYPRSLINCTETSEGKWQYGQHFQK